MEKRVWVLTDNSNNSVAVYSTEEKGRKALKNLLDTLAQDGFDVSDNLIYATPNTLCIETYEATNPDDPDDFAVATVTFEECVLDSITY